VQQVGVKFYICLMEVYVIKDDINAFNKTLNKPSKADSAAMLDPHYALLPNFFHWPHWTPSPHYWHMNF